MIRRTAVILFVMLLWGAVPVTAGVVAETDRDGNYLRTLVFNRPLIKNPRLWNIKSARRGFVALNTGGDVRGDLYPQILESSENGLRPWVIWSRFNGTDFDLAWSRWIDGQGWQAVSILESSPALGDDLDPAMAFDPDGRPTLVWWSDDQGTGRIYFTMCSRGLWGRRFLVSDPMVDSRYPSISVHTDGLIEIEYLTPIGTETRILSIMDGVSINDDSDPIFSITVMEMGR